jgi:hypothetical protein
MASSRARAWRREDERSGRSAAPLRRPRHRRVRAEPCRPRTPRSRARPKAEGSLPHMDDAPAVAAEVIVAVRQVRADGDEGVASGASVHERLTAGVVGGGAIGATVILVAEALAGFAVAPRDLRDFSREHRRHDRRGQASVRARWPRLPGPARGGRTALRERGGDCRPV